MTPDIAAYAANSLAAPAMLVFTALFALFTPVIFKKRRTTMPAIIILASVLAVLTFFPAANPVVVSFFNDALTISPLTHYMWPLFLAILALTTLISLDARADRPAAGEYYFLLTMAALALMIMVSTDELLTLFIALELMSVSVYALSAVNRSPAGAEAGYKYFLLGSLGAAMLVMGLALTYGTAGSLNLGAIKIAASLSPASGALAKTGFLFLIAGLAFKVALAPFHMWVPDVYEGSPTPVSAFMGAAVKAGGVIALYRLFTAINNAPVFADIFWLLTVLTMVSANLLALPQQNLKRLLAYSSIAHAGYIMTGFFGGTEGFGAILFYLAIYAFANIGAFAVVLSLEKEERGITLADLAGLAGKHPYLAGAMSVFMLSLAGIPPLAGFFAKFYLFASALKAGCVWLVIIAVLMSAVSVYYYLRVLVAMYMTPERPEAAPSSGSGALNLALTAMALASVLLGIFSGPLLRLAQTAAVLR